MNDKKSGKVDAKKMKLISDIVWGWELGKMSWINSLLQWRIMLIMFKDNFIILERNKKNIVNDNVDIIVGYAFIVPVKVTSENDLIKNERKCSHFNRWKLFGKKKYFYLSEIIIHEEYRNTKEFLKIFNNIIEYCKANNISVIYTTAVSNYSRKILRNKRLSKYVELLEVKEEHREVYKINVGNYVSSL